ncbi:MAG TPA: translation initiation factor [Chitinophagaceae bacterium]|jgi:translation initiation factor 1
MNKKKPDPRGFVYSTDPNFQFESNEQENMQTVAPALQKLQVRLDQKNRGGKAVTLVQKFIGETADLETLGKQLKTHCGTGGAVKDGEIIIQGDQRDKIMQWLQKNGYKQARKI